MLDRLRLPHGDVPFEFVPKKGWHPEDPLKWNPELKGYVDRKNDVWRKGLSRAPGHPFEWDVQLRPGSPWTSYSRNGKHLNIDVDGRISH